MENLLLAPQPGLLEMLEGSCPCTGPLVLPAPHAQTAAVAMDVFGTASWPPVALQPNDTLAEEAYILDVTPQGATVSFSAPAGLFYALMSLGQLAVQGKNTLPCCHIQDAPALPVRGLMYDISRGKVATLETLMALANKLAMLKMNHFELYIEGFSFAYPTFPQVWQDKTPITPDEVRQLDAFCRARHIELVPNQNSLGHMAQWLALPQFASLAEKPEGGEMFGFKMPPTTMDPTNPGSLALVEQLTDDLLPNFASNWFNVGLDEPFELGQGKNAAALEAGTIGSVYLDYVKRLHRQVVRRGKRMLMWGDIVQKHPELVEELPKDIVVLEWGYEAEHPFEERATALEKAGLDFLVCPGTSSWSSYAGITDNMLTNVRTAAGAAHAHGAMGLLLTDWGDGGHPQYLPVSYAALVLAASLAWNPQEPGEAALADALDTFVFKDAAGVMGRLALEAGRFMQFEEFLLPCRTFASLVAMAGFVPGQQLQGFVAGLVQGLGVFVPPVVQQAYAQHYQNRKPFNHDGLNAFLDGLEATLKTAQMACPDAALVQREFANTLAVVRYLGNAHAYVVFAQAWDGPAKKACLEALVQAGPVVMEAHAALWQARNKPYGLQQSMDALGRIAAQAGEQLQSL